MVGTGHTCEVVFFIWSCFNVVMSKLPELNTYAAFWDKLAWSMDALLTGLWPSSDEHGVPYRRGSRGWHLAHVVKYLADGWRAMLFRFCGDLDYLHNSAGLERWSKTTVDPCMFCTADNSEALNWKDFRPNAGCFQNHYTPTSWHLKHPRPLCGLFNLAFFSILSVAADWMHVKYLGTDQQFFGCVLELLVMHVLGGADGNPKDCVDIVWSDVLEYYNINNTTSRYARLTLNMFHKPDPKLRGRAAEIKHVGPALLFSFRRRMGPGSRLHNLVRPHSLPHTPLSV